jgi:hypothetical protein
MSRAASTTRSSAPHATSPSVAWSSPDMGARTTGCPCLPRRLVACLGSQITRSRSPQRGSSGAWSRGYAGTEPGSPEFRAVGMPRAFRASAMARRDLASARWTSRMIGSTWQRGELRWLRWPSWPVCGHEPALVRPAQRAETIISGIGLCANSATSTTTSALGNIRESRGVLPRRLFACFGSQITRSRSPQRGSSGAWSRGYAGTEPRSPEFQRPREQCRCRRGRRERTKQLSMARGQRSPRPICPATGEWLPFAQGHMGGHDDTSRPTNADCARWFG